MSDKIEYKAFNGSNNNWTKVLEENLKKNNASENIIRLILQKADKLVDETPK